MTQYLRSIGASVEIEVPEAEVVGNPDAPKFTSSGTEVWLKIGQSNSVGTDGTGPILWETEDAKHPRVFELSRGINRTPSYLAAPAGSLHMHSVPAQDDASGIGFGLHFGKRRAELNPDLKVIIVNRGVGGTGFTGNRWNPGDDLYAAAVADANLAMANNPGARFGGFIWHQGESDVSMSQTQYETALNAMVTGMRSEITGAANGIFLAGTMVPTWIGTDSARLGIDAAHRNIANVITNADFVDFSDLTDFQDSVHFGTGSLRIMGRRYAEKAQPFTASSGHYLAHHLKIVDGELVDLTGNGAMINGNVVSADGGPRGEVLDVTTASQYSTSINLNPEEYTKALWVNLRSTTTGYQNMISGDRNTDPIATSHFWGVGGFGQVSASALGNEDIATPLGTGAWHHIVLSRTAAGFELYMDGLPFGVVYTANNGAMVAPQGIIIGAFGANYASGIDALMDDIVILPYAVDGAGAIELYNSTL